MSKLFTLEGKGLKLDTAADIESHISPLVSSNDVEEVRFQGNTLGVEACAALAKILATKKSIRIANLADIFTSRLLSEIPPSLTSLLEACLTLPNLHTINLSDNAFGLNTVEPLRPFLSQHVPLQHLILNNNGLGPAAGTLVAEALTQLAARKASARTTQTQNNDNPTPPIPDLETVVCGRNRLETGSMKAWAEAYRANTGVREVRMVQNGIRQEGIEVLLRDGLSHATKLQTLDLQDNTFTAKGSKALADAIRSGAWMALKELGVGDCLLSARGGVGVFEALGQGKTKELEVVRAQYNEVDARGLKALAAALSALPKLRRVEVNGNKFAEEDESVEEIRRVLDERKEAAAAAAAAAAGQEGNHNSEDGERWGVDELDDLEEEDSDEEDEAEDEGEDDGEEEKIVKEADVAEDGPVAADKDDEVDELAAKLGKTGI